MECQTLGINGKRHNGNSKQTSSDEVTFSLKTVRDVSNPSVPKMLQTEDSAGSKSEYGQVSYMEI
jgi:hypothetical protein